jgi:hypothetical protein
MKDERLIILILGATILIGMVASFVLEWMGKGSAATFTGVVTTTIGVLCPSPLFGRDRSPEPPASIPNIVIDGIRMEAEQRIGDEVAKHLREALGKNPPPNA